MTIEELKKNIDTIRSINKEEIPGWDGHMIKVSDHFDSITYQTFICYQNNNYTCKEDYVSLAFNGAYVWYSNCSFKSKEQDEFMKLLSKHNIYIANIH